MFLLSNICGSVPHLFLSRGICCGSACHSNPYITLGLTPSATQAEVKKAYFELCKKYHPDKNDGSIESTRMFREITEAYEILGNEKSRKLYDQKMFYARPTMRQTTQRREDYNYEAERDFYERTHKTRRYTGKTKHYDFDAWVQAHYPKSQGQGHKTTRDFSRTWRKDSHQRYTFYTTGPRAPIVALNLIGFFLIGMIIISMPTYFYTPNYGIDNDLANRNIAVETSKSGNTECDIKNP